MKNKKMIFIATTISLIVAFFLGSIFYKNYEKKRLGFLAAKNSSLFVREYSPQYGNKDAKVFLIEFLDPECESCRMFYPKVKSLLKEFDGKVKLVIRYAPFHRNSQIAIRALEASRIQGKYWEALELLFENQPAWADHHNPRPHLIFEFLARLGLDIDKLKSDMKSQEFERIINQDLEDLRALKVRGTPTFFVNGKPLEKFGMDALRKKVEEEVQIIY